MGNHHHHHPELAEDEDDFTDHRPPSPKSAEVEDSPSTSPKPPPPIRNAFTELMAPKPKQPRQPNPSMAAKAHQTIKGKWRGGLGEYITHPERFPPSTVIRYTEHTVLIRDLYPKAMVHLLLLPRSDKHVLQHPTHALSSDPEFLALMRREAEEAVTLAAAELERLLGKYSATNKAREEAMMRGDPPETWPAGRDWRREIRVGTHAHPSMAHLHVHIISRDMHSERVKHKKHYNSFNTEFFIPLEDYPLGEGDRRWDVGFQNANINSTEFKCWRCGRGFGNRFAELKRHLEEEFVEWRAE
ncbi:hypothetical protein VTJ04DRAFT_5262 [Mycothermus thermophilus]|uniref:uncharacterized protein n=1 Tax=Humicola insolens TaxID=85995 RepID=UPI003741E9DC